MAAERDQAGTAGPGLTGAGRDASGLNAGTSGSASMGDRGLGSAEVHTGLHSGGSDQMSGLQFAGHETQSGGVGGRLRDVADRVGGPVRNLTGNLGPRVSDAASTVRERAGTVRERAHTALEQRGMLDRLRDNPLPVLGVAFAIGFLLAARDDDGFEESRRGQARSELRDALMAGVTAGLAQGARGFLSQAGSESTGFVNTLIDAFMGKAGVSEGGSSTGAPRSTGGSTGGTSRAGTGTSGRTGGTTTRRPSHQEY